MTGVLYDDLASRVEPIRDGIWRCRTGAGWGSSVHVFCAADNMVAEVSGNRLLTVTPDGEIRLDSCGWHTRTTSMAWNLCIRRIGRVWSRDWRYYFGSYDAPEGIPFDEVSEAGIYRSPREVLTLRDR